MESIYNQLSEYLEKEHSIVILRTFTELSESFKQEFFKNYTDNTDCLSDPEQFVTNGFYNQLIPANDFKNLSTDSKNKVISYFTQLVATSLTKNGTIDMDTIETIFKGQTFNIDNTQINTAKNMINKTLGLDNSAMGNIVESMVGDISNTLNTGVPFKDMIQQLSQSFGDKLRNSVSSGSITEADLQNSTKGLFDKLQTITSNPAQLIQTLSGAPAENKQEARQERRKKAREEARQALKKTIREKEQSRKHK